MNKKRGLLNVGVSITFKIILLVSNILVRRFLIKCISNDINGLNSLYLSILDFLAVAELGIGSAITYCMYKPIVDGDTETVFALYRLFKKIYLIIGLIITIGGCALMPALPYLAKGYESTNVNLYLTFGIMLASVVATYFFSAQTSLMNAYEDNYLSTAITSLGRILQYALQLIVLFTTASFVLYLICRLISAAAQFAMSEIIVKKRYPSVFSSAIVNIGNDTKNEIIKNVKAMFLHRVGSVLVNTIDSVIISAFIGVAILGKYSNYVAIMTAMTGTISLFFTPLTSMIGHLFVKDKAAFKKYFGFFFTLNFCLGCVFFLGYYAIIDNLVSLLFGKGLELEKTISFVITVNYFIQFMRNATLLFRDASGTFYYDRFKPLAEGLSNLALSILFVILFKHFYNDNLAVVGVIIATIITNLFICHIVEPHVLHKYAFGCSAKKYYARIYSYIFVFVAALIALNFCTVHLENKWLELLANGCIAIAFSILPVVGAILSDRDFKDFAKDFLKKEKIDKQTQK